jgi:DNA repair protein RecO
VVFFLFFFYTGKVYQIHSSEGIILETQHSGDADAFYLIYTKDFGLIRVLATGVRLSKSKLKYSLQTGKMTEISFVKGKSVLRLTHAKEILSMKEWGSTVLLARLFARVTRLVRGEEKDEDLYELLYDVFIFMHKEREEPLASYEVELLFAIKLLFVLGYWNKEEGEDFLEEPFSEKSLKEVLSKRNLFITKLNHALELTQL